MNLFSEYQRIFFDKSKKDKHFMGAAELNQLYNKTHNWKHIDCDAVFNQMIEYMATNGFYFSLAMAMDSRAGLAKKYPDQMKELAQLFMEDIGDDQIIICPDQGPVSKDDKQVGRYPRMAGDNESIDVKIL